MLSNICVPPGSLNQNFSLLPAVACLAMHPLVATSTPAVLAFQWFCTYSMMPESVGFTSFSPSPNSYWSSPGEAVRKSDQEPQNTVRSIRVLWDPAGTEPLLQYVASMENQEPPEYPPSQAGKPMLALDSCNTFMICEQETSKATKSQSPSSLSWQSTVVVIETGAVRGAPPATSNSNSELQLRKGRCSGTVPPVSGGSSPQGTQW